MAVLSGWVGAPGGSFLAVFGYFEQYDDFMLTKVSKYRVFFYVVTFSTLRKIGVPQPFVKSFSGMKGIYVCLNKNH